MDFALIIINFFLFSLILVPIFQQLTPAARTYF